MIALYRKLAGIHCPQCGAVQPVANLRMAYASGFSSIVLHKDVGCVNCAVGLRFVERQDKLETWVLRIAFGLCQFLLTITVFFAFLFPLIGLFGLWGLLALPVYFAATTLIGAWFFGITWPFVLEVRI